MLLEQSVLAQASPRRPPMVLRCAILLLALKVGLSIWGFGAVMKWIYGRVRQVPVTSGPSNDYVKHVEHSVAVAGALYPGRARCLEQSLALYYLLRRRGIAARYCQGVMAHPFEAHAWVEYRGEVLNDIPEHVAPFARLPDQLP